MAITTLARVKTYLGLTNTTKDALITMLIPLVEADYLRIRNKAFDLDDDDDIVYPTGSELTAIKMVAYHLMDAEENDGVSSAIKSESLSRHSITYNELKDSYPPGIIGSIRTFEEAVFS